MFLRRRSKVAGGERYEYWSLCESVRTAAGPRQREVACLSKLTGPDAAVEAGWEDLDDLLAGRQRPRAQQQSLPFEETKSGQPAAVAATALMGKGGFHALLSRALAVAGAEMPCLLVVTVNADGILEGWEKAEGQADREELTEAGELLVVQLLGLLVAFIGGNLTLRVVREVWPMESLDALNFTPGDRS